MEVVGLIRRTIEEVSLGNLRADLVRADDDIIGNLGLDSLDYATIMLQCERTLGITIVEDGIDWRKVRTVQQLAELLHSHL